MRQTTASPAAAEHAETHGSVQATGNAWFRWRRRLLPRLARTAVSIARTAPVAPSALRSQNYGARFTRRRLSQRGAAMTNTASPVVKLTRELSDGSSDAPNRCFVDLHLLLRLHRGADGGGTGSDRSAD